ncbi:MAG TPA: orotidine-5'-phosphate decarboxylase [Roseiflexaceae bacterium]|nr:orotidine-5'-phosphate decarboxylase [Roseiflexaceae bacterium]
MRFVETLLGAQRAAHSLLCVGLDPLPERIPAHLHAAPDPILAFCAAMMEATADVACAFKPNIAFFEALGAPGIATLQRLCALPRRVPLILDAKRGDIGSTAQAYARLAFEVLRADAVTLSPYLGGDSLAPFLRYAERGCFVLCKTSNPGSADVQDLPLAGGAPLYLEVARRARSDWNANGNVGLVVGATHPGAIAAVRATCPNLPLLVPGVGAQGGELEAAVRAAVDAAGELALINASRSILYASAGTDFAQAARAEAIRLRDAINAARAPEGAQGPCPAT